MDVRDKVAIEAIKCAAQLDRLVVMKHGDKTATQDKHVWELNSEAGLATHLSSKL